MVVSIVRAWLDERLKTVSHKTELFKTSGLYFWKLISYVPGPDPNNHEFSDNVFWEICQLVNKGKIDFSVNLEDWLTELNKKSAFQFVVIDNIIAYNSQALPGNFHKDPADRFIVATAIQLGATIVTKDQKIRRYKHVKTIW